MKTTSYSTSFHRLPATLGTCLLVAVLAVSVQTASCQNEGATLTEDGILKVTNPKGAEEGIGVGGETGHRALELSGGITVSGVSLTLTGGGFQNNGALVVSDGTTCTWDGPLESRGEFAKIGVWHDGGVSGLNVTGGIGGTAKTLAVQAKQKGTVNVTGKPIQLGADATLQIISSSDNENAGTTHLGVPAVGDGWGETRIEFAGKLVTDVANALPPNALLSLGAEDPGPDGVVEIDATGTLDLNGFDQTIGGLRSGRDAAGQVISSGSRLITSDNAATLTVNQGADTLYDGQILGAVSLVKAGKGNLTLAGPVGSSGAITVKSGGLDISGTVVSGALSVGSGAKLGIRIRDNSSGGSGRVVSNGLVTVAGGSLDLTVDGALKFAAGDVMFLIVNNSKLPVSGAFKSVSVGGVAVANTNHIVINGQPFQLVYNANYSGAGSDNMANDVALAPVRGAAGIR
ncbi:MAG: hypothetical protein NTV93_03655 [Verrucomicrobia bacterium]|nr:hypothetical protein [Verrucomicrobiota bacterium]